MSQTVQFKKVVPQKLRRNERERKRVNQVNLGFNNLRDRVPRAMTNKKLSKVETLREAARYIAHLKTILEQDTSMGGMSSALPSPAYPGSPCQPQQYYQQGQQQAQQQQQYCEVSPNSSYYSDQSCEDVKYSAYMMPHHHHNNPQQMQ